MKKVFAVTAFIVILGLSIAAQADVFNLGTGFTNLEKVAVGDPGNVADTHGAGYGAVAYNYNIGKYEVTAGQYTDFLNNKAEADPYGLYSTYMDTAVYSSGCNIKRTGTSGNYSYTVASDWANRPVNYVSYWDACRFANWLGNGQGSGDTETGAYTLGGYNGVDGQTIHRNAGWKWAVTSEDEWYKAAYYKGGSTNAGYWDYPTKSDTAPSNVGSDGYTDPGNHANWNYTIGSPYYRTNVGEFENSASAYGTFDQCGNVFEWNEATLYVSGDYAYRGMRGGSFYGGENWLQAAEPLRTWGAPPPSSGASHHWGFRVSEVPEPTVWGITPNSGLNTGSVSITDVTGTFFQTGTTIKLTRSGQTDIAATGVIVVSATRIRCAFDLTGKAYGQWSVVVTNPDALSGTLTNGFTVIAEASLGLAKSLPAGSPVGIEDAVVTAPGLEFGSVFVESSDRSGGIKLVTNQTLSPGDRVKFTGHTDRMDGEYRIDNVVFTEPASPGAVLSPILMSTPAVGNDKTETLNYVGINTTGMMVKVVGKVTGVITAQNVVYLDDGGNYEDGYAPLLGLRCHVHSGVATTWKNKYYAITGISRVQKVTLTIYTEVNGNWYEPGTVIYVPYVDALSAVQLYP